eukprot:32706_3
MKGRNERKDYSDKMCRIYHTHIFMKGNYEKKGKVYDAQGKKRHVTSQYSRTNPPAMISASVFKTGHMTLFVCDNFCCHKQGYDSCVDRAKNCLFLVFLEATYNFLIDVPKQSFQERKKNHLLPKQLPNSFS